MPTPAAACLAGKRSEFRPCPQNRTSLLARSVTRGPTTHKSRQERPMFVPCLLSGHSWRLHRSSVLSGQPRAPRASFGETCPLRSPMPQRLSPFHQKTKQVVTEIYRSLAKHADFAGLLFHDDALLNDFEDASPWALEYYAREWGLPASINDR